MVSQIQSVMHLKNRDSWETFGLKNLWISHANNKYAFSNDSISHEHMGLIMFLYVTFAVMCNRGQ